MILSRKTLIDVPAPSVQTWRQRIANATEDLDALSRSTEQVFLDLGNHIQNCCQQAKDLSQRSTRIADSLSGQAMHQAIDELRNLLDHVRQQMGQSSSGAAHLVSVLSRLSNLQGRLGDFDRTIRNLRVLCHMIQVESARLGHRDTQFSTLSDDVKALATHMDLKARELTDRLEVLKHLIGGHLSRIEDFGRKEQGHGAAILDNSARCLDAILSQSRVASRTVDAIAVRWRSMSEGIGEVASSLQFHDITRQRIEHVCEALTTLEQTMDGGQDKSDHPRPPFSWAFMFRRNHRTAKAAARISSPCAIQTAQLRHAQMDLGEALKRIKASLGQLNADMIEMSAETRKAAGTNGQDGGSFVAELEGNLSKLKRTVAAFSHIHHLWGDAIAQVTQSIGDMSTFIGDIVRIGTAMRIVALNSCIHAARIGDDGQALGVLAEAVHGLSLETEQNIDGMSENLSTAVEEARGLAMTEEALPLETLIASLMGPIRKIHEEQDDLLRQIDDNTRLLSQDLGEALSRVEGENPLEQGMRATAGDLESLLQEIRSLLPTGETQDHITAMVPQTDRYTMEKERQVHAAVLGTGAAMALFPLSERPPENEPAQDTGGALPWPPQNRPDDLGDNVELF